MAVAFHTLTVADVEELTDDAVAVTFEVPDDLADEFEFVPGQSLTLRRMVDGVGAAPPVLHLRPGRRPPAGRRPRDPRRAVLALAGPRRARRRRDRGADAERPVLPRPGAARGRPAPVHRRRLRHHADAVGRLQRAGERRRGHPALRQPHHRLGDVRRGARRPQEPLRPAAPARPRAQPRAARRRAVLRPAGRRPAAPAADHAGAGGAVRPRLAVRPARDAARRPGGAGRARRTPRPRALRALLRRRAAARAAPRRGRGHRARPPR